jgi:hypothetical protein
VDGLAGSAGDESASQAVAAARKRLGTALKGRPDPQLAADAVEWSTSFDAGGWQDFAGYLAGQLRGDLTRAVGRATIAVAATAPIDEEDHVLLDTMLGAIRLGWFVDDTDTIDVYVWGPAAVTTVCEAWPAGSSAGDH